MENVETTLMDVHIDNTYSWSDKTILVAEDIDLNYLYIHEILNPTKANIVRVENGKAAVDYILNHADIDMILMDLLMPVMNGYEATRQIKLLRCDIPIIAQTAYNMAEDRKKAWEAGCDDFIAKPIEKADLLQKINYFFVNRY